MAQLAAAGAGAADGLEILLARLRADEELKQGQQRIDNQAGQFQQTNQRILEQNQLQEKLRRDALVSAAQKTGEDQARKNYDQLGPEADVTGTTRNAMVGAGLPPEAFKATPETATVPSSIALSGVEEQAPIAGTVQNAPAPSMIPFKSVGTPEQRLAIQREKDAAAKTSNPTPKGLQHVPVLYKGKPVEATFDPESGGFRIGTQDVTGQVQPVPSAAGNTPIVFNVPGVGPQVVDRRSATSKPVLGTDGNPLGAGVTPQERTKAEDTKVALTTLGRLDQDIDAADKAGVIAPIGGRIADLDARIGDPNPIVSTLGTRMLLAKMKMDSALGGVRAAASPQLLARWDNLLASKMDAQNLHATVAVMRQMMQDTGSALPGSGRAASGGDAISVGGFTVRVKK